MPTIHVPSVLRRMTNNEAKIDVAGTTVAQAIRNLCDAHPDLARHLLDDDRNVRPFVRLFVGPDDTQSLDGPETAVGDDATIRVVPAIAGG